MSPTPLQACKLNASLFNKSLYRRVWDLWFKDVPTGARTPLQLTVQRWFGKSDAFDLECKNSSWDALESIGTAQLQLPPFQSYAADRLNAIVLARPFAELDDIAGGSKDNRAEASLTLVLLLDQFSRNIYRDNQQAIYGHYDRLARALVYCILSPALQSHTTNKFAGINLHPMFRASPPYQMWFTLPLMHSEDLEDHDELAKTYDQIRDLHPGDKEVESYIDMSRNFEKKHRTILEQFGRYPHRNTALGRTTTAEEREWMEKGGDSFGTG